MPPDPARLSAASLIVLVFLGGCAAQVAQTGPVSDNAATKGKARPKDAADGAHKAATPDTPPDELWARIRAGFALDGAEDQPAVRQWIQFYAGHEDHLLSAAERARPFLWHIVEAVEAHGMPLEIALLPIVESGFDPFAHSRSSASGLWQIMPMTARRFGLERDWWYDERRDVLSSTNAALDYLAWLHGRFDDWLLALAAYNAGEGRVDRAIARAKRAGRPTDFWHLELPEETENYVPKLLALRRILRAPERFALEWPTAPNRSLIASVELPAQVELSRAAEMIDIPAQALRSINPGFRRWATRPDDTQTLLVPAGQAEALRTALAEADPDSLVNWRRHRVARGEVLGGIAERYGTTVDRLQRINNVASSRIHPGDELLVPAPGGEAAPAQLARNAPTRHHRVRRGDSLWKIARRYGVEVTDLRRWNGLGEDAVLQPGLELAVRGGERPEATTYSVQQGDSLWSIARALDVAVADLREWNDLSDDVVLQPGQRLEVHTAGARRLVHYRVRSGDSLWSIASRFSVDVAELRDWNGLAGDGIRPGQKLRILVEATS